MIQGGLAQDKQKEIRFFDEFGSEAEYNVFNEESNARIIDTCLRLAGLKPPAKVADLGCGSGIFSSLLAKRGFQMIGVDLSPKLVELAKSKYTGVEFAVGDVEFLPMKDESLDGVMLSGLLHHLPDPTKCIHEVHRVLRPGGRFMAFDPNRANPFMYLYRDPSSPLYSSKGVTPNERPILARDLSEKFKSTGFSVQTDYLSNLQYQYVASPVMRHLLPIYNALDSLMFRPGFMKPYRAFVITAGQKLS